MTTPAIVVSPNGTSLESSDPFQVGVKTRRSFCMRLLRKSNKNIPSTFLTPKQQAAEPAPGDTRRSRSASPSSAKRKEVNSPLLLKRKYLRKVKFPPMPQLSFGKGQNASPNEVSSDVTPSTFEEELAGQENQSPNDPEFVRRASERWRRRTGAVQLQPPLQLLSPNTAALQPTFQWPSSPTQQPAFQRRVSPRPVHYGQSPFLSVPTSPTLGVSPFRRCNTLYSSFNKPHTESSFKRSSYSYTSLNSLAHSRVGLGAGDQSPSISPKPTRSRVRAARYVSPGGPGARSAPQMLCGRLALDDSVAEEMKKAAKKEQLLSVPNDSSVKAPFRRLSSRLRRSLRSCRYSTNSSCNNTTPSITITLNNNTNSDNSGIIRNKTFCTSTSSSSISSCCNDNTPTEFSSFTSSTSYQSFLSHSSGYSSACSSTPSSPSTVPRQQFTLPVSYSAVAATGLAMRVTFQDIFLEEPQIAEKFAIMFPTEPRPEWHRHLRQVLNKAGQKIFKKGESHETTIPENLRHQLKHIYVY